jgi:hypothetical protein
MELRQRTRIWRRERKGGRFHAQHAIITYLFPAWRRSKASLMFSRVTVWVINSSTLEIEVELMREERKREREIKRERDRDRDIERDRDTHTEDNHGTFNEPAR